MVLTKGMCTFRRDSNVDQSTEEQNKALWYLDISRNFIKLKLGIWVLILWNDEECVVCGLFHDLGTAAHIPHNLNLINYNTVGMLLGNYGGVPDAAHNLRFFMIYF